MVDRAREALVLDDRKVCMCEQRHRGLSENVKESAVQPRNIPVFLSSRN